MAFSSFKLSQPSNPSSLRRTVVTSHLRPESQVVSTSPPTPTSTGNLAASSSSLHPQPESQIVTTSPERQFPTPASITKRQRTEKTIPDRDSSIRVEHSGSLDSFPSVEQSSAPSQIPSTPQTPRPQSQASTVRELVASASSRGGVRGRRLNEDDEVLLARVCCRYGESFGKGYNWVTSFWIAIAASFQIERNGACYSQKSCRSKMDEMVAQRRVEIVREESGAERNESDWANAVDEWIAIVDSHNTLPQQSQDTAAEIERKPEEAVRRLGQKRKRTRDKNVSATEEDSAKDELSGDERTSTPRTSVDLTRSSSAAASSRRKKKPRPDDTESQSTIRATIYLERPTGQLVEDKSDIKKRLEAVENKLTEVKSDTRKHFEVVENKLTELLDLMKAQLSRLDSLQV